MHPWRQAQGGARAAAGVFLSWLAAVASAASTIPPAANLTAPAGNAAADATPLYDAHNPPAGIFDDEWMEVFMAGQKVGYAHTELRRRGDRVLTAASVRLRLGRATDVVEMSVDATTEETVDGQPRAFHNVSKMGSDPVTIDGQGDGRIFTVSQQTGAYVTHETVTLPADALLEWGQDRREQLQGFAPGTHYTLQGYNPGDDYHKIQETEVTVGPPEKLAVGDTVVTVARVTERIGAKDGVGGINTINWVDARGRLRKTAVPLGPMTLEMTSATQAQALATYLPADIFSASLMTLDQPPPAGATAVTYRLSRRDGQPLPAPPASLTEHGEKLPDGSARLTLRRPAPGARPAAAGAPLATAPYLERNAYMDTQDETLRRLAAEAGGPAGGAPAAVAARLRDFVSNYITKKDYSVGFATASEVARTREGDCTEHAVLLAALGRVRGLPTRVAAGLAYMPDYQGQKNVLGYHMWAQFYLDGQWVDYDAALPELPGPPRRLALAVSSLDDESAADFSLALLDWLAELRVTVEPAPDGVHP